MTMPLTLRGVGGAKSAKEYGAAFHTPLVLYQKGQDMKIQRHMYITKSGSVRITSGRNQPKANEIRIAFEINVPDSLFRQPDPVIEIDLPESIYDIPDEVVLMITSQTVADQLGLRVDEISTFLTDKVQEMKAGSN